MEPLESAVNNPTPKRDASDVRRSGATEAILDNRTEYSRGADGDIDRNVLAGRRTHDFPRGRPKSLIALEVAAAVAWVTWSAYSASLVRSAGLRLVTYVVLLATFV